MGAVTTAVFDDTCGNLIQIARPPRPSPNTVSLEPASGDYQVASTVPGHTNLLWMQGWSPPRQTVTRCPLGPWYLAESRPGKGRSMATTQSKAVPRSGGWRRRSIKQQKPGRQYVSAQRRGGLEGRSQKRCWPWTRSPVGKGERRGDRPGRVSDPASHMVPSPAESCESTAENGKVVAMRLIQQSWSKALLSFSGPPSGLRGPPSRTTPWHWPPWPRTSPSGATASGQQHRALVDFAGAGAGRPSRRRLPRGNIRAMFAKLAGEELGSR